MRQEKRQKRAQIEQEGIPPLVYHTWLAEVKKTASYHPMDMAIGALAGGAVGAYMHNESYKPREHTPQGESYDVNKLRHEMAHQQDIATNRQDPSFADRLHERIGRAKMRYANIMQDNTALRLLSGAAVGAAAGAVAGHGVGQKARNSVALQALFSKGAEAKIVDQLGLRRDLIEKKASYLGLTSADVVEMELRAAEFLSLPQRTATQEEFLHKMAEVQNIVSPPQPMAQPITMNASALQGVPTGITEGSIWSAMMQKAQAESQGDVAQQAQIQAQQAMMEPDNGRSWTRSERGKELLGIFGGPSEIEEEEELAGKIAMMSTPSRQVEWSKQYLRMGATKLAVWIRDKDKRPAALPMFDASKETKKRVRRQDYAKDMEAAREAGRNMGAAHTDSAREEVKRRAGIITEHQQRAYEVRNKIEQRKWDIAQGKRPVERGYEDRDVLRGRDNVIGKRRRKLRLVNEGKEIFNSEGGRLSPPPAQSSAPKADVKVSPPPAQSSAPKTPSSGAGRSSDVMNFLKKHKKPLAIAGGIVAAGGIGTGIALAARRRVAEEEGKKR